MNEVAAYRLVVAILALCLAGVLAWADCAVDRMIEASKITTERLYLIEQRHERLYAILVRYGLAEPGDLDVVSATWRDNPSAAPATKAQGE